MSKTILKCMSELTHCLPFHFEQQRVLWVQDWYLLPTSWCHWKVQLCCQKCSKVQLCYKRCPLPPHQSCSSSIWDRPYFQSLSVLLLPVYPGSESNKSNYKLLSSNNILATFTLFQFRLLLLLNPLLLQKVNTNWETWPPPLKVPLGPQLSSSEALTPAPPAGEGGLD